MSPRLRNGIRVLAATAIWAIPVLLAASWLAACGSPPAAPTPTPPPLAEKIVLANWPDDIPQSVLDAFTTEYGVRVTYAAFESMEQATANIRKGVEYDVVALDNRYIPDLVKDGLLATIDSTHVPNLKNISANFRDLVYDPGNHHSVPYNWGTTGLVVRSDLTYSPVDKWSDLWDPRYAGKIGLWRGEPRETVGLALRSLGYSANSEQRPELEAALDRLRQLKRNALFVEDFDPGSCASLLESGKVIVAMGWSFDALKGRALNPAITYVLPKEGALLWGDNFVIPANSARKSTAEVFLNFLLRPKISAEIANQNFYATPNEAAFSFIKQEILNDPVVFPPDEVLKHAEIILPLSAAGQRLHDEIWQRFMAEGD